MNTCGATRPGTGAASSASATRGGLPGERRDIGLRLFLGRVDERLRRHDHAHRGRPVRLLIDHDDVLAADLDTGTVPAEFTIDHTRGYQPKKQGPGENRGPAS